MGYIKKLFYKSEVQFDNDKFTIRIILTNVLCQYILQFTVITDNLIDFHLNY